jgi:hypothetical protein
MAVSSFLTGDLFKGVTETGREGSQALFGAHLGDRFRDWGGMFSPQSRTLGNYFDNVWQNYLGEILAGSPSAGLGQRMPGMPGRSATEPPTSFADYLRTTDFSQMYAGLAPYQRGFSGSRFQPIVKRIR